jgi:hypothetical protein
MQSERELNVDSKGFLQWCITFRINGSEDFVHRLQFEILENTMFWKLDLVQCLWLAVSKGPNRVGASFPSSEGGNRPSFRTTDKVHKRNGSE